MPKTYFKNLARTLQNFQSMFGYFSTLCIKELKLQHGLYELPSGKLVLKLWTKMY